MSSAPGLFADLGYADQAHLIRDFRAAIGQTPAASIRLMLRARMPGVTGLWQGAGRLRMWVGAARRLSDLCEMAGVRLRTLQRMFLHYAGASPTWVIRRYRLLEAAEAVREGTLVSWAQVAATSVTWLAGAARCG